MWIVAAAAVAVVGCRLGQADDAPGLDGLSLLLALAMVLHAFISQVFYRASVLD